MGGVWNICKKFAASASPPSYTTNNPRSEGVMGVPRRLMANGDVPNFGTAHQGARSIRGPHGHSNHRSNSSRWHLLAERPKDTYWLWGKEWSQLWRAKCNLLVHIRSRLSVEYSVLVLVTPSIFPNLKHFLEIIDALLKCRNKFLETSVSPPPHNSYGAWRPIDLCFSPCPSSPSLWVL